MCPRNQEKERKDTHIWFIICMYLQYIFWSLIFPYNNAIVCWKCTNISWICINLFLFCYTSKGIKLYLHFEKFVFHFISNPSRFILKTQCNYLICIYIFISKIEFSAVKKLHRSQRQISACLFNHFSLLLSYHYQHYFSHIFVKYINCVVCVNHFCLTTN